MSNGTILDPFERLPFLGYLDAATGRQEQYLSLAHFIHAERLRGADENYRDYLLRLDDPELLRLEVDGVDITGSARTDWSELQGQFVRAGIFMQAAANRARYTELLSNLSELAVAASSMSDVVAVEMGNFVSSIRPEADQLKVLFLGDPVSDEFAWQCMQVLFANRLPNSVLALEDDSVSQATSEYARQIAAPFSLLSSSAADETLVDCVMRRCTHVFNFEGLTDDTLSAQLAVQLIDSGFKVTPIARTNG